ncbi:MAG: hypothetical protein WCD70_13710 [Alphaproteobacteria bacterium]
MSNKKQIADAIAKFADDNGIGRPKIAFTVIEESGRDVVLAAFDSEASQRRFQDARTNDPAPLKGLIIVTNTAVNASQHNFKTLDQV